MKPRALFVALLLFAPAWAHGTQVSVPDDYATIQGALDSHADTVWVRSGTYAEALRPEWQSVLGARDGNPALPVVTSIEGPVREVKGIVFTGPVAIRGTIEECWCGAGVVLGESLGKAWHNIVFGDITTGSNVNDIAMNTIIGGGILTCPVGTSYVHRNTVLGPAPIGIRGHCLAIVNDNYVRGCVTGIDVAGDYSYASGNVVEDCSGTGISFPFTWESRQVAQGNSVRRCGGDGIHLTIEGNYTSTAELLGNSVDSVGGTGIFAHGHGVVVTGCTVKNARGVGMDLAGTVGYSVSAVGNCVVGSGSDGVVLAGTSVSARGNVIGRSGGRGLVATGEHVTARSNTLYLNHETGLELGGGSSATVDSVDHNVAYQNGTGLRWLGPGTAVLGCNDWYKNTAANTEGVLPGASDLALNPLFCDMDADDGSLSAVSALLQPAGCGLVGALGQGCSYPAAVVPPPSTVETGLRVFPQPGGREVRLSWQATGEPVDVVVYDVVGARRWRTRTDGNTDGVVWQGVDDDGRLLPAGVYFARIGSAGRQATARVVLVR